MKQSHETTTHITITHIYITTTHMKQSQIELGNGVYSTRNWSSGSSGRPGACRNADATNAEHVLVVCAHGGALRVATPRRVVQSLPDAPQEHKGSLQRGLQVRLGVLRSLVRRKSGPLAAPPCLAYGNLADGQPGAGILECNDSDCGVLGV
mgnify:CR=1 FL=1